MRKTGCPARRYGDPNALKDVAEWHDACNASTPPFAILQYAQSRNDNGRWNGRFDVVSAKISDGGALSNRGSFMQPTIVQAFLTAMWALLITANALARDGNQWGDPRIKEWFENLKQPDHPRVSCCGEADAYEADNFEVEGDHYIAIITGHRAVTTIPLGSRIPVPRQKMKFDAGNPTGHGIIFIDSQRRVLCYVTPAAG
jgi:hypothetical protein